MAAMMVAGANVMAQVSHGGEPMMNYKPTEGVTVLPTIDNKVYLQQDMDMVRGSSPLRVGVMQDVNLDSKKCGETMVMRDGTSVWRLAIESPNATFVWPSFSTFELPEGARLFVYTPDGEFVLGSFDMTNKQDDNTFYTQALPGSKMVIEYIEPAEVAGQGHLVIDQVCHGYKDIFRQIVGEPKGALGNAEGDCHINVVCDEGDDWRLQIRSVVAINIVGRQYSYMCSGTVMNNTNRDRTPYVLTAHHCQDISDLPERRFTTYFGYQATACERTTGTTTKSITGATMLAKKDYSQGSDFLLLLLKDTIPFSYKPYFAGWDRSNDNPTAGVCIHHPGGDIKKISFPRSVAKGSGSYAKFLKVYWFTGSDNKGVTEQGSSGSALFNADKRVIGQLWAGSSSCTFMSGNDWYGRLYNSWSGSNDSTRVKNYLDPLGTNVQTLSGMDYNQDPNASIDMASNQSVKVYPNPSKGMVYFDIPETGKANYKVYDMSGRCVKEGNTVLSTTTQAVNLSTLGNGMYTLVLYTSDNSYTSSIVISK